MGAHERAHFAATRKKLRGPAAPLVPYHRAFSDFFAALVGAVGGACRPGDRGPAASAPMILDFDRRKKICFDLNYYVAGEDPLRLLSDDPAAS